MSARQRFVVTFELTDPIELTITREHRTPTGWEQVDREELSSVMVAPLAAAVRVLCCKGNAVAAPDTLYAWWLADGAVEMTARNLTSRPMPAAEATRRFAALAAAAGVPTDVVAQVAADNAHEELLQLAEDRHVYQDERDALAQLLDPIMRTSRILFVNGGA